MANSKNFPAEYKSRVVQLEEELRQLKAENGEYKRLFENSPLSSQSLDEDGNIIKVNNAWLKNMGYSLDEVIGHNFGEFIEEGWRDHFSENFPVLKTLGEVMGVEFVMVKKGGEKIFISLTGHISRDCLGNFQQTYCVFEDITERRDLEIALVKSEERFRLAMDATLDGLWDWDLLADKVYYSPGYLSLLGYSGSDIPADKDFWVSHVHPEDRDRVLEIYHECISGDTDHFAIEFRMQTQSGEWIWVLGRGKAASRDKDRSATRLIGTHTDITKRKRAENELRGSEERYRTMMEALGDPVYICSPDKIIQYMNRAMIKRLGSNATGEYCYKALHDFEHTCSWCKFDDLLQGQGVVEMDIKSPKDNRSYHISNTLIVNSDNSVSKMTVYRDTTDIKVLEKQLQQALKMDALGTLAGGIAHDFNNILTAIVGYTQIALGKIDDSSPLSSDLAHVMTGAERATELVKQILTFARQDENDQHRPLKIQHIITEALKLLRSSMPATIELQQFIDRSCRPVLADSAQIHQLIMNLCTNARQAIGNGHGLIKIDLRAKASRAIVKRLGISELKCENYLQLTVLDNGCGMEPWVTEQIFDPFFTTKKKGKGTGLGLAVVHGVVKKHYGEIVVDSTPGIGTRFDILFPVVEVDISLPKEDDIVEYHGSGHIMVVEDEIAVGIVTKKMLESLGYKVTCFNSAIDAILHFRENSDDFELVLTDMTMPRLTGKELAHEILTHRPEIPVVLMTGYSEGIDNITVRKSNIREVVYKPLTKAQLSHVIRDHLDHAIDRGS